MDRVTRDAILRSFDRAVRMFALVEGNSSAMVGVDRIELQTLLDEHTFVCSFALGASPHDEQHESKRPTGFMRSGARIDTLRKQR